MQCHGQGNLPRRFAKAICQGDNTRSHLASDVMSCDVVCLKTSDVVDLVSVCKHAWSTNGLFYYYYYYSHDSKLKQSYSLASRVVIQRITLVVSF